MQQQSLPHPFLYVLLLCAIHLYQIYTLGCKETLRVLLSSSGTLDTLTQITDSTPVPMQSHLPQPLGPPTSLSNNVFKTFQIVQAWYNLGLVALLFLWDNNNHYHYQL